MLPPYEPGRNLRSSNTALLEGVNTTLVSRGDRAFAARAPKMWNALPTSIKCMDTIASFKKHLKHHLFSNFREFQQRVDRYLT